MPCPRQWSNMTLWKSFLPPAAMLLFALSIFWSIAPGHLQQVSKEETFLNAHDSADGYLIPVDCGALSRGFENVDFVRGRVGINGKRTGKDVCLYSRRSFDLLFAERIGTDPEAAHRHQAWVAKTTLQKPSGENTGSAMMFVSIVWTAMSAGVGYLNFRRLRRTG